MPINLTDTFVVLWNPNSKKIRIEPADEMLKLNIKSVFSNTSAPYVVVGIASPREEAVEMANKFEAQLQSANLLP